MDLSLQRLKTIFRFKYKRHTQKVLKNIFWFLTGAIITLILLFGVGSLFYQTLYNNQIYPGIKIQGKDFGGKTKADVKAYFDLRNEKIGMSSFVLKNDYGIATVSAKEIGFGYDSTLLSEQAYLLGRSVNVFSNMSIIVQAYTGGVKLSPSYKFSQQKVEDAISEIKAKVDKKPIDAQFKFENGRVTTFKASEDGQTVNLDLLFQNIHDKTLAVVSAEKPISAVVTIPIKIIPPAVKTEEANNLGIKELIGQGSSLFYHSIPSRIYNINLAAERLN